MGKEEYETVIRITVRVYDPNRTVDWSQVTATLCTVQGNVLIKQTGPCEEVKK